MVSLVTTVYKACHVTQKTWQGSGRLPMAARPNAKICSMSFLCNYDSKVNSRYNFKVKGPVYTEEAIT